MSGSLRRALRRTSPVAVHRQHHSHEEKHAREEHVAALEFAPGENDPEEEENEGDRDRHGSLPKHDDVRWAGRKHAGEPAPESVIPPTLGGQLPLEIETQTTLWRTNRGLSAESADR